MEFAGDQVLNLTRVRSKHKGKAVDLSIHGGRCLDAASRVLKDLVCFANDEGEVEEEFVVAGELQEE